MGCFPDIMLLENGLTADQATAIGITYKSDTTQEYHGNRIVRFLYTNTIEKCVQICTSYGYSYAALDWA